MYKNITSLQHPLVKHLSKLQRDPFYRREKKTLVLNGIKPINEICSKYKTICILTEDLALVPEGLTDLTIFLVTKEIIKKISSMKNPEGILAELPCPSFDPLKGKKLILALDGISDPGNMGTLLRTALALGWEGAFILENCVDLFNDKTINASRGAIFRLPLMKGTWQHLEHLSKENDLPLLITDIAGKPIDQFQKSCILVLGNEAKGSIYSKSNQYQQVAIPMSGDMESLNVAIAGGILMYLFNQK